MADYTPTECPKTSIENALAASSRDHSNYHRDAWIYGIVFGWGDAINDGMRKLFSD